MPYDPNARHRERWRTDPAYKQKQKEATLRWQTKNAERYRGYLLTASKIRVRKKRERLLDMYGRVCTCCGEAHFEFLAIDHTNGGGNRHIAHFKDLRKYYNWLLEEKREGFRVLCHNCNQARGFYGYCPHEQEVQ